VGIVWPCRVGVEEYAAAGRSVAVPRPRCPACRSALIFWSGYERFVRRAGTSHRLWIRRGKCRACKVTHALLPVFLLRRRLDPAAVIGGAVARMLRGVGARPVADALGVPHTTARDWRRRHRARAPTWLARAEALIVELGGELPRWSADVEHAAIDALITAWRRAASRATGTPPPGLWQFVSAVSGGSWLSTTTSPPWASPLGPSFISATPSRAP
jgi:transposase-like protein